MSTDIHTGYTIPPQLPRGPLTARNLEDFSECPRKYLLSFFGAQAGSSRVSGGPGALHRAVRTAVIELYRAGGSCAYPLEHLLRTFEEHWDGSVCLDSREEEDLHRQGLIILRRHWENPLALGGSVHSELRLEGEVQGHQLVAVADVAASEPPTVVRFTTSRRPPSPRELRESLSWGLLFMLGKTVLGGKNFRCLMVDLRKERVVEYSLDEALLRSLEMRIASLALQIEREREYAPRPGKYCRWCRSRDDCSAWRAR